MNKTALARSAPAVVTLFLFVWLSAEVLGGGIMQYDDQIRAVVHQQSAPPLTLAMHAFTILGSPPVLWPLAAIAWFLFWQAGWRREALLLMACMLGVLALDTGLKRAFHRPRPVPFFDLAAPDSYSYPSGHAIFALCLYGALAWLANRHLPRRAARLFIWTAAVLLIASIGFSRIYLGVHYPSDVAAGYCAAFVWMSVVVAIARRWFARS